MTLCEYPDCIEEAEYRTDKGTYVCRKHYNIYKFLMPEIKFVLEEDELNKVNWY